MYLKFSLLLFFIIPFLTQSQEYQKLKNSGELPSSFTKNYDYLNQINTSELEEELGKKDVGNFENSNNSYLKNLYTSGILLYNDPVTIYLTKILDKLLKNKSDLRSKINIYCVKSAVPNAFTTIDGSIFVNLGLIARVHSEDELAFVISHEIAHFEKQHVVQTFVESRSIDKKYNRRNDKSGVKAITDRCLYSQDLEKEADLLGLTIFEESEYSWRALSSLFGMLRRAELPVFSAENSLSFLNNTFITLNDSIFLDGHQPKNPEEYGNEEDEISTHPVPELRLKLLLDKAVKKNDEVYDSNELQKVVKTCKLELMDIYLKNYDYHSLLYLVKHFEAEQEYKSYVDYHKVRALYGAIKLRLYKQKKIMKPSLNYKYSQFMYNMFDYISYDLKKEELGFLAYAQALEYISANVYRKSEVEAIANDLAKEFKNFKMLKKSPRITFKDDFRNVQITSGEFPNVVQLDSANSFNFTNSKSTIVVNPEFIRLILKKKENPIEYNSSQKNRLYFEDIIRNRFNTYEIESINLDNKLLNKEDLIKYNDISLLEDFYYESTLTELVPTFVSIYGEEINEIRKRYNSDYAFFPGAISIKLPKENEDYAYGTLFLFGLVTIPASIYYYTKPNEQSAYYLAAINLRTGSRLSSHHYSNMKANQAGIDINIGYLINQVMKK